jgi:Protein of unknown function (DUF2505)
VPRSFEFSVESSASVEQTHLAYAERDYWLARLATFGGLGDLESLTVDSDGTVTVVVVTALRHDGLPGPVAKFFPREWRVVQNEKWSPVHDGQMRGEVSVISHGAPMSGTGTALLTPTKNGSQLKCQATVGVKVPLIGGKVESVMGRLLVQNISAMQGFTTEWVQEHA